MNSPAATVAITTRFSLVARLADYAALGKLRLSSLVIFSALFGYGMAVGTAGTWLEMLLLAVGGLLVTGAANALNQVWEARSDARMRRTANRPVASARLSAAEAVLVALLAAVLGLALLFWGCNPATAAVSLLSLLLYTLAYTPLKQRGAIAVPVGAVPGALPPLIGWVAGGGSLMALEPWALFALQFAWQFPHFWAIAWVGHDDYQLAGLCLLPHHGRNRRSALWLALSGALMLPLGLALGALSLTGLVAAVALAVAGLAFALLGLHMWQRPDTQHARRIMMASFFYLPLVQIALWVDLII